MLVVQDIFLTETGYLADVILPASAFPEKTGTFTNTDRIVQLGRQALDAAGRGAAGPRDHHRDGAASSASTGTTRIRATCSTKCARRCRRSPASPGSGSSARARSPIRARTKAIPGEPRRVHRAISRRRPAARKLVPAEIIPAAEQPDAEYPVRADHRPPARALAHRQHDAARRGARRDRADAGRVAASARPRGARRRRRAT